MSSDAHELVVPVERVPTPTRVELASSPSLRMRAVHAISRRTVRPVLDTFAGLEPAAPWFVSPFLWMSSNIEVLLRVLVPVPGTTCRRVEFEDFTAEWVWHGDHAPEETARGAILYCHGGGFLFGGLHSHRRLVSRLARATGLPVLNVDYRQLPEATIRESQADALTAYRHLLDEGFPAGRIMFAGDSAGGGLVFSTAFNARSAGLPMPAGIMAISPLADYDSEARFVHDNDLTDGVLSAMSVDTALRLGMPDDGEAYAPLEQDFAGLPPVLIQTSGSEVFLADAVALHARCVDAGVPCEVQIWHGAVHVFHAVADLAPEGHRAIADMGRFSKTLVDPARFGLQGVVS